MRKNTNESHFNGALSCRHSSAFPPQAPVIEPFSVSVRMTKREDPLDKSACYKQHLFPRKRKGAKDTIKSCWITQEKLLSKTCRWLLAGG